MSDIIILPEHAHCFALTAREAEEEINKNFMANVDICDTNLNTAGRAGYSDCRK